MPSEDGAGTEGWQALHPSTLLFSVGAAARRLLIPGIVVLVASRGDRADLWLMILFVPAVVAALLKYVSYRYRFGREEIVVREGIVTRNERHIPYARIQNIDSVQNPLHRLLRVAEVRLETASGDEPEAVIRVLSLRAIGRMRSLVFERKPDPSSEAPVAGEGATVAPELAAEPARVLLRLPTRELILLGFLSKRGMALVAAALGLLWQFGPIDLEARLDELAQYLGKVPQSITTPGPAAAVVLAVIGALAVFLVLKVLSVGWILLKYHGFTLSRRGDDLRTEYGLLTRVSATIPRHRIQKLSTRSGPLQRRLRRLSVQVETAGGSQGGEGSAVDRLWIAPIIRRDRLSGLLSELMPGIDFDGVRWRELEPGARGRVLRRGLFLTAALTVPFCVLLGFWGLAVSIPAALLAVLHARQYVRHTRYSLGRAAVLYRHGWLRRRLSVVRHGKIQVVAVGESPFDRRAGMASLRLDTAGAGRVVAPLEIHYLGARLARIAQESLYRETSRTVFRW
jgi:putative membrane protein